MDDESAEVPLAPRLERRGEGLYRATLPADNYRSLLSPGRRREVAMVVERTPGWVLLQTKTHYPPGIFRLPTGTVGPAETCRAALVRELHEEANLVPGEAVEELLRLEYDVEGGRKDFVTVAYHVRSPRGHLRPNDPTEDIGAWREAPMGELLAVAADLCQLEPPWSGWGCFRSLLHRAVALELQRGGLIPPP